MLTGLNRVPTSTLFPTLTSLIHPATPTWFRVPLSTFLSLLPLRPNGVQQTISFIASTAPQPQNNPAEQRSNPNNHTSGLTMSVDTLDQVSKLLAAVPSSLTPGAYFSALSPQLLQLLDGTDVETKRAVAYVVGNGILGRRKHGSPGTVGWKMFAQPILDAVNPKSTVVEASKTLGNISNKDPGSTVVSETALKLALDRLTSLVLLHPNPGLTKRLIAPSLMPLWGLWYYSKETKRSSWADQIYELFYVYFKTAAGVEHFISLIDELQWSGGSLWTYGSGPRGGIELRQRLEASHVDPNIIAMVNNIDGRIDELMRLLRARVLDDDGVSTVFLHTSKRWLLGNQSKPGKSTLGIGDTDVEDPLLLLGYAKVTQKILEEYKDKLAANPSKIIDLVNQLLISFITEHRNSEIKDLKASKPSIAGLSRIFNPKTERGLHEDDPALTTEENRIEMVSIALNLLSAILPSTDLSRTARHVDFIDIQKNLSYLATCKALPISVVLAASNILHLTDVENLTHTSVSDRKPAPLDQYALDCKAHSLALTYLVDPLPPIRAQGLSLLTELLKKSSPVLDISSTSILLISLLQDEDEYIYLSAIQALSLLASRHPRTVVKMLLENYVDASENKELDIRIRIGEALLKTVESLGEELVGEAASLVGEGMIAVAGRRGRRVKQMEAKVQKSQREVKANNEAEDAWGGEVSETENEVEDGMSVKQTKVLEGWEGIQGEEDVRIRTSALSIIGVAIETNVGGLGSSIVATAVDLALTVLKTETTDEKAILRRAAVLVIMSLVRALDAANEGGRKLDFGFAAGNLADVISVLRYIEATDSDELVIGHIRVVIEGLETWQSKAICGVPRSGVDLAPKTMLNGSRLAGLSVNPEASMISRPVIEEVE